MQPNYCPNCGSERKYVPAGFSQKTQKNYNAFWSCPNNCKVPRDAGVSQPATVQHPAAIPQNGAYTREPIPQPTPPVNGPALSEAREQRIARESALSTVARVMEPQEDLIVGALKMIEAADYLVRYINSGIVEVSGSKEQIATEDVDPDSLPF